MRVTNAQVLVSPSDNRYDDGLWFNDGKVSSCGAKDGEELDFQGDIVVPGFVDLHTDALETRLEPRPGVEWPPIAAIVAHDNEAVAAGVTTVFNAVCVGTTSRKPDRMRFVDPFVSAVVQGRTSGLLKADHRLHVRCEVTDPMMPAALATLLENAKPDAMSIMDHAPGKRQIREVEDLARWMLVRKGESAQTVKSDIDDFIRESAENGVGRSLLVSDLAKSNAVPFATHDDETIEHIDFARQLGANYSEFPVTLEAARHASTQGIGVVMGAPNVVRGQSSGGNVSAKELIDAGLVDALLSDYVPTSQFHAIRGLAKDGLALNRAVSMITDGAARLAGLPDRGKLLPGMRADFVRLREVEGALQIRGVWSAGRQVVGA